jgi:hypothetical protein
VATPGTGQVTAGRRHARITGTRTCRAGIGWTGTARIAGTVRGMLGQAPPCDGTGIAALVTTGPLTAGSTATATAVAAQPCNNLVRREPGLWPNLAGDTAASGKRVGGQLDGS